MQPVAGGNVTTELEHQMVKIAGAVIPERGCPMNRAFRAVTGLVALLVAAGCVPWVGPVEVRLETGGVANPSWLSASFIPDLRGMAQATAVLDDARLVIDGIARSAQAHAAVVDSVAGFGARGVKVDHRIEIRP